MHNVTSDKEKELIDKVREIVKRIQEREKNAEGTDDLHAMLELVLEKYRQIRKPINNGTGELKIM